jgi:hypothetical protein
MQDLTNTCSLPSVCCMEDVIFLIEFLHLYIYICVCVCVCVCARARAHAQA